MSVEKDQINCLTVKAKLAEQAERYDEMSNFMSEIVHAKKSDLTIEERNLLSVAFKNSVGARRVSLRILSSLEAKHRQRSNSNSSNNLEIIQEYQQHVSKELETISNKIITLLNDYLLSDESKLEDDARVFYWKMKGDYHRYLSEFAVNENQSQSIEEAQKAYDTATQIAEANLTTTSPVRLGLALNYSVFFYEIKNNPKEACKIAKNAFDSAISHLDNVEEELYRDSTLIMQLLRDNLTLWTNDLDNAASKTKAEAEKKNQQS